MNNQEHRKLEIDWLSWFIIPLLKKAWDLFGEDAIDWIKDKMEKAKDGEAAKYPCTPPKEWNSVTQQCQDPIGKK